MAATIPTTEPTKFRAGDTIKWTKTLADYSAADSWILSYSIRGSIDVDDSDVTVSTHSNGTDFSVVIASTFTSTMTAGTYWWLARVTLSGEVFTVDQGTFTVTTDIQAADGGSFDGRSAVKVRLDSVQSAIDTLITNKMASYNLDGRTTTYLDLPSLMTERDRLKQEYASEIRAEKLGNGLKPGLVRIRF
jgi:hypothetical protein